MHETTLFFILIFLDFFVYVLLKLNKSELCYKGCIDFFGRVGKICYNLVLLRQTPSHSLSTPPFSIVYLSIAFPFNCKSARTETHACGPAHGVRDVWTNQGWYSSIYLVGVAVGVTLPDRVIILRAICQRAARNPFPSARDYGTICSTRAAA